MCQRDRPSFPAKSAKQAAAAAEVSQAASAASVAQQFKSGVRHRTTLDMRRPLGLAEMHIMEGFSRDMHPVYCCCSVPVEEISKPGLMLSCCLFVFFIDQPKS